MSMNPRLKIVMLIGTAYLVLVGVLTILESDAAVPLGVLGAVIGGIGWVIGTMRMRRNRPDGE
jgi:hypothetical protein